MLNLHVFGIHIVHLEQLVAELEHLAVRVNLGKTIGSERDSLDVDCLRVADGETYAVDRACRGNAAFAGNDREMDIRVAPSAFGVQLLFALGDVLTDAAKVEESVFKLVGAIFHAWDDRGGVVRLETPVAVSPGFEAFDVAAKEMLEFCWGGVETSYRKFHGLE